MSIRKGDGTMTKPTFDPKELDIVKEVQSIFGTMLPVFNFPISMKESRRAAMAGKPVWQITSVEMKNFAPKCNPDDVARASVFDGTNTPADQWCRYVRYPVGIHPPGWRLHGPSG